MDARRVDDLLAACHVLFGHRFDPSFLGQLQESGLRSAWRSRALQTHPDRTRDPAAKRIQAERFIEARLAYSLLREFLGGRAPLHEAPHARTARHGAGTRPHQRPRPHRAGPPRRPPASPGHLPGRRLRLGEFLYHVRAISFGSLIEAIVWQRRQRDRFLEVGLRWGYLSDSAVLRLLSGRRPNERVGAAARRLNLLSEFQVRTVLAFQRSRQEPIGRFFTSRGLISPADLELLLLQFEAHNEAFARR